MEGPGPLARTGLSEWDAELADDPARALPFPFVSLLLVPLPSEVPKPLAAVGEVAIVLAVTLARLAEGIGAAFIPRPLSAAIRSAMLPMLCTSGPLDGARLGAGLEVDEDDLIVRYVESETDPSPLSTSRCFNTSFNSFALARYTSDV